MVAFNCDNSQVEAQLERLKTLVLDAGGVLDEKLIVNQAGSALWLSTQTKNNDQRTLISLPSSTLLRVDKLELDGSAGDIVITGHDKDLPDLQRDIADCILTIYNLTGKLGDIRTTHPLCQFADNTDVSKKLMEFKPELAGVVRKLANLKDEGTLLKLFLGTRTFGYRADPRQAATEKTLMPFIDLADHCSHSPSYQRGAMEEDGAPLELCNSQPILGSANVYVCYSASFDLMDLYLGYGFLDVESQIPRVRAAPCTLSHSSFGEIDICSQAGQSFSGKLGQHNADLRRWLPRVLEKNDSYLRLSHLYIPGRQAPRSLRRALRLFISALLPDREQSEIYEASLDAEAQIVDATQDYYTELRQTAAESLDETCNVRADLISVCDRQLAKVEEYRAVAPPP